jgi:lipopolysaccharide transport system permease protein
MAQGAGQIAETLVEYTPAPVRVPSLLETAKTLVEKRFLLGQLAVRELLGVYKGSFLGAVWSFLYPLLLLVVYAFVFSRVFKMRWSLAPKDTLGSFALILFCGSIPFTFLSQVMQRSTMVVIQHANLVTKVVFPLDLLPASVVTAAMLNGGIATVVLLVAELALWHRVPPQIFYVVPLAITLLILALGLSYILAALGVFVRDVANIVPILTQMLFFLTPITYPLEAVPEKYRVIVLLNPLAPIVIDWRNALLTGQAPHWRWVGALFALGLVTLLVGHFLFHRMRRAFAEVL